MQATLQSVMPQTRCYHCGSTKVKTVCHHCGRPMCATHTPEPLPQPKAPEAREFGALDISELRGRPPVHCKSCQHPVRDWLGGLPGTPVAIGILAVGLVAIVLTFGNNNLRAIGILGGILIVGLGAGLLLAQLVLRPWLLNEQTRRQSNPFPLLGGHIALTIQEAIRGHITLSEQGAYQVQAEAPTGQITARITITPRNGKQFENYRKLNLDTSAEVKGGTVVIKGRPGIEFDVANSRVPLDYGPMLMLRDQAAHYPLLTGENRAEGEWVTTHHYRVTQQDPSTEQFLPITVVPILVAEGEHRAIELTINLQGWEVTFPQLKLEDSPILIEEFKLKVSHRLGQIEDCKPNPRSRIVNDEGNGEALQELTWQRLALEKGSRHKTFYLSFENDVDPKTVLRGHLIVQFPATLSSAESLEYFNALGRQAEITDSSMNTRVEATFTLHLQSLSLQKNIIRTDVISQDGISPSYEFILRLTDVLRSEDFYVKRIVEDRKTASMLRAHAVNRYWDLNGRAYLGIYPVDFHLVVKGEGMGNQRRDGFKGSTSVEITVDGTVTDTDNEMQRKVEEIRQALKYQIEKVLKEMREE